MLVFGDTWTSTDFVEYINLKSGTEWNTKQLESVISTIRTGGGHYWVKVNNEEIIVIRGYLNNRVSKKIIFYYV